MSITAFAVGIAACIGTAGILVSNGANVGVAGGLFDLGFDEVRWLFADGFESGDTSAWSSVAP